MSVCGTKPHNIAARELLASLLRRGERVAAEVGVPGGRIDLLRLGPNDEWLEIIEVKLQAPLAAVGQLLDYSASAEDQPDLTIVIPPRLDSARLRLHARDHGIAVRTVAFSGRDEWLPDGPGELVLLPYFHHTVIERMSRQATYGRSVVLERR